MYSIGEFSRISGLSIKALRIYHEMEVLVPRKIDESSGYRYYDRNNYERAMIIKSLRDLEFGLTNIKDILQDTKDEADIVDFFEKRKEELVLRVRHQKQILKNLDLVISREKEAKIMSENASFEVEEKDLDTILIAGVRFKGKYSDCGDKFGKIGKSMGRFIAGKPFNLYYDSDYKETDADIESCMPVRKGKDKEGISIRELPGGSCASLIHKGPYETISRSYEKIIAYVNDKGYKTKLPTREVYLKGPGMIFKGKPDNYLTEIQIMIEG